MKVLVTEEWCRRMAELEGDHEVGVGYPSFAHWLEAKTEKSAMNRYTSALITGMREMAKVIAGRDEADRLAAQLLCRAADEMERLAILESNGEKP